jgi:hypothetical protein
MAAPTIVTPTLIRCQCEHCRTPIAEVRDGRLVIVAKHHDREHVNELTLADLVRLLEVKRPA